MGKLVKPIKPSELVKSKQETIPDVVLDVFNRLITQDFHDDTAVVKQDDVVDLVVKKGFTIEEIFSKGWLNVEELYRAEGWHVTYDKPGFNENYPATFKFSVKK